MLKRYLPGSALAAMAAGMILIGNAAASELAPQSSDEHGVKVTVTPPGFSSSAKALDFEVSLETHTQNLGDDLAKSALLMADGKQYEPLGWEGAAPGGHHRKGVLRFKAIVPPRSVELQILLSGDTSPRSFTWRLK
jgi:hypothetical protein